jgi:hypothetical protein
LLITLFLLPSAYSDFIVTMNRLTREELLRIVHIYFENRSSVQTTYGALRPIYGPHKRPSESATSIRALMNQF